MEPMALIRQEGQKEDEEPEGRTLVDGNTMNQASSLLLSNCWNPEEQVKKRKRKRKTEGVPGLKFCYLDSHCSWSALPFNSLPPPAPAISLVEPTEPETKPRRLSPSRVPWPRALSPVLTPVRCLCPCNPSLPWEEGPDAAGAGIPLSRGRLAPLLPLHRHLTCPSVCGSFPPP